MARNAETEAQMRSMRLSQQNAAMDAYAASLLAEIQRPAGVVHVPDDFASGYGGWIFPNQPQPHAKPYDGALRPHDREIAEAAQAHMDAAARVHAKPAGRPAFEDAFVYRPKVEPKKPFDWTLPLPEPWASRFCKLYFAMLAATPLYVLWALL